MNFKVSISHLALFQLEQKHFLKVVHQHILGVVVNITYFCLKFNILSSVKKIGKSVWLSG